MHASLALAVLSATVAIAAPPAETNEWVVRTAEEVEAEGIPIIDLVVTNENFPGQNFTGTAASIYEEMKALKPELFETWVEFDDETLSSLSKRQGSINCDWNSGNRVPTWNSCIEGLTYLMNLGGSLCGVDPSPACARVSCSRSCGMFLCNKRNYHAGVPCGSIPADINAIASECISSTGTFAGARDYADYFIGLQRQSC